MNLLNILNYCEIDTYASKAYSAIHGVSEALNLGDITKVKVEDLPEIDCLVGGSPCTDFSLAGYRAGTQCVCNVCGHEFNPLMIPRVKRSACEKCGSSDIKRTRSALLTYYLDVLAHTKPKFALYENVANILSKRFRDGFDRFVKEIEDEGYNVYFEKLNAKNFYPQNRDRLILLAVRKDQDNGKFKFPAPYSKRKSINDLLDSNIAVFDGIKENVVVDPKIAPSIRKNIDKHINNIVISDKNIYSMHAKSGFQDNQVGIRYSPALRASNPSTIVLSSYSTPSGPKHYIKRLTPNEAYRFMGFDDGDYRKVVNAGISNTQIYKQAGNSIVVEVVYAVLKELYEAMPYLFDKVDLIHLFSGIGAFEKAFYRIIEEANAEGSESKAKALKPAKAADKQVIV